MNANFKKRMWIALVSAALWAVFLAVNLAAGPLGGSQDNGGELVYKSNCSICHAVDGSGNTAIGKKSKIPDLRSSQVQQQSDAQLAEAITNGKGKMKAYKDRLSAAETQQVVGYLRELAKQH